MLAAGENIYDAQAYLNQGNFEYAAGDYGEAYQFYSKAYAEATFVELGN